VLFFLLAFLITWSFFIPAVTIIPEDLQIIFIILGAFGPLLSAVISIRISYGSSVLKDWLRTIFKVRIPWYLYLLGMFVLPIGVGLLQLLVYLGLGGELDFSEAQPWFMYLFSLIPTALLSGGNEEPGWRGFALPALLERFKPWATTLILGFFHAAWHLPLMNYYGTNFLWYLLNVLPLTFFLNWFYLISRWSAWPVMFLHAGTNVIGSFLPTPREVLGGLGDFMVLRGIVYWLIALAIIFTTRGQLGLQLLDDREPG
jgi:membrane protease YdiL (CAAX protease family)